MTNLSKQERYVLEVIKLKDGYLQKLEYSYFLYTDNGVSSSIPISLAKSLIREKLIEAVADDYFEISAIGLEALKND